MSVVFFAAFIGVIMALGNAAGIWAVPVLVVWLMFTPLAFIVVCLALGLALVLNELRKDDVRSFDDAMHRVDARQRANGEAAQARIRARNSARTLRK